MSTATAYTKAQLEMMAEVVASDADNLFAEHYKTILANYSLKPDVKAVESAPKGYGKGTGTGGGKKPLTASLKQLEFIGKLLASRVVPDALRIDATAPNLSIKAATKIIDALKLCPWIPKEPTATVAGKSVSKLAEDGFYFKGGCYYKVKTNVKSGKRSASLWDPETLTWGWVKGMVYKLTEGDRVTMAMAEEFGTIYERCMGCNHKLSNDVSVAAAMGPICRGKFG